jgi:hypothetical protein
MCVMLTFLSVTGLQLTALLALMWQIGLAAQGMQQRK